MLADRVRRLIDARSGLKFGHDEQTAAQALGYVRRSDHPWSRPVNEARRLVVEPAAACGPTPNGLVFDASDSTG